MMIVVSVLGIAVVALGGGVGAVRARGAGEVQRERALQVLEYQAAARHPDAAVTAALLQELPDAKLVVTASAGTRRVSVSWAQGSGRAHRDLVLAGETP